MPQNDQGPNTFPIRCPSWQVGGRMCFQNSQVPNLRLFCVLHSGGTLVAKEEKDLQFIKGGTKRRKTLYRPFALYLEQERESLCVCIYRTKASNRRTGAP